MRKNICRLDRIGRRVHGVNTFQVVEFCMDCDLSDCFFANFIITCKIITIMEDLHMFLANFIRIMEVLHMLNVKLDIN